MEKTGLDAIYFGLERFNAPVARQQFYRVPILPRLMEFLHLARVKGWRHV